MMKYLKYFFPQSFVIVVVISNRQLCILVLFLSQIAQPLCRPKNPRVSLSAAARLELAWRPTSKANVSQRNSSDDNYTRSLIRSQTHSSLLEWDFDMWCQRWVTIRIQLLSLDDKLQWRTYEQIKAHQSSVLTMGTSFLRSSRSFPPFFLGDSFSSLSCVVATR